MAVVAVAFDPLVEQALGGPVERVVGLGQSGGAAGGGGGVEPAGLGELFADAGAVEAVVRVARVGDGVEAGGGHDRRELGAAPAEQRAGDVEAADLRRGADPGEPRKAGAAGEAHRQGLDLVVGMVGGEQPVGCLATPPTGPAGDNARRGPPIGGCPRSARRRRG